MTQKQGAKEAGYVNFGYFSPELSSNEEYPEYIKERVAEAIEKIKSHQNAESISFAFIADVHYSKTENHDLRTTRLVNAYKAVKEATRADVLVLGGDHINNGVKAYSTQCFEGLKEHLSGLKYFPVNGNHDDNSIWDTYVENEKAVNHHTTKEMYNLFYSHVSDIGAKTEGEDSLYYYYDDEDADVRYIFLDSNDIPEIYTEDGKLKYTKQQYFAMSQKQVDWLINTALDTKETTSVLIFTHNAFFPSLDKKSPEELKTDGNYAESKSLRLLNEILDAYNQKSSICKEYGDGIFKVSVDADFSKRGGRAVCVLAGHHHKDIVEKTEGGLPIIFSDCTIMYNYRTPRVDGDPSELLLNIVTVDRSNRKIFLTRIGAGEDRVVDY